MAQKPKIMIFIDWYLPGTKAGGPVRSVYSLVSVLKNYFNFYVITTNLDLGSREPYQNINTNTLFFKEDVHYYYFDKEKLNTENILTLINEINPELLYLNSFWSFNFSINIVRLKKRNQIKTPILLAPRGMLGKGAMSLKSSKKRLFLIIAKISGLYKDINFHATQEQEKKDILAKFQSAKVSIASNINSGSVILNQSLKRRDHLNLFYLSRIDKVKNLHFSLEILKSIPLEYKINYELFGNMEDKIYWEYCKALIDQLPENITVTYKGEIAFDKVQEKLKEYNGLFLPTLNENFGHSIVESLLCGCPVIISDQTPWNDLEEFGAGYAIDLNNKQKFIDSIIHYAKLDQEQFNKASSQAINYISKKIDIDGIVNQYKTLFNDSIKN